MAQLLRDQRMNYHVGIWTRGIDREIFNPARRDMDWRRGLGIEDDVPVIGFVGRLVMEKGLDVFSDSIDLLERRGSPPQGARRRRGPGPAMIKQMSFVIGDMVVDLVPSRSSGRAAATRRPARG